MVFDRIAAGGSLLFERLALIREGRVLSGDRNLFRDSHAETRLSEWAAALDPGGRPETLLRFLAWEGISLEMARQAVAEAFLWPAEAPLPAWVETLRQVVSSPPLPAVCDADPARRRDAAYPFEDVLVPFVRCFHQRIKTQSPDGFSLLTAAAVQDLEDGLLARLAALSASILYSKFEAFRTDSDLPPRPPSLQGKGETYIQFARSLQGDGLMAFFLEFPVLARLLAVQTDLWGQAQVEFLQRLAQDRPDIERVFGPAGGVARLWPGLSDPHQSGRTVCALRFESGLRLVYKPKSMGIAVAYQGLLAWLNQQKAGLDLKTLQILARPGYGWTSYIAHQPCANQDEALRYFRRMGSLLAIVYLSGGSDCHAENIIACGEYPVLVDEETLLRPQARMDVPEDIRRSAVYRASRWLATSVVATGILPGPGRDKRLNKAFDTTALGAYLDQNALPSVPKWININTDAMCLAPQPAQPPVNSLPFLRQAQAASLEEAAVDVPLDSEAAAAVAQGFTEMAHFWLDQRAALLAPEGPLAAWGGQAAPCVVRFVFRNTRVYGAIQARLMQPRCLRSGLDYGIYLERLARVHLTPAQKPSGWPVLAAERAAMQRLDVPFFTAHTNSDTLFLDAGGQIAGYFVAPSLDQVLERLRAFDEAELTRQLELVRQLLSLPQFLGRSHGLGGEEGGLDEYDDELPWSQSLFASQAAALGKDLERRALWGEDGGACWVFPRFVYGSNRFEMRPVDPSLYDGLTGIVLFLAALEKTGVWPEARRLRLAATQALQIDLQEEAFGDVVNEFGLGGGTGVGSLLYGLARAGQMLADPDLLEQALRLALRLRPEHLRAKPALDVLNGAAGLALGLTTVYEITQEAAVLERAVWCGQFLLEQRIPGAAGGCAWRTGLGGQLLTGFAHGAAGIAYALLRLYAASQSVAFLEAAQEALAYENSLFVEAAHNWPDLRDKDECSSEPQPDRFGAAWCVGAAGIGLGRLGGLSILDTPVVRQDIASALIATQDSLACQSYQTDHLCCGVMGQVEFLLEAGLRLDRPDLIEAARRTAMRVVGRADRAAASLPPPIFIYASTFERGQYNPVFYRGAAGIGYELLRLAYPNQLTSILTFR